MAVPVLTELQRDALKEVGNIGAGHAATALSEMLNTPVRIINPTMDVMLFGELAPHLHYGDAPVALVLMDIIGSAPGRIVVVMDREKADRFVTRFLSRVIGNEPEMFVAMADSTIAELANIIGGAYLTALIDLTGLTIAPSVPTLLYGSCESVLQQCGISDDQPVFLIETGFEDDGSTPFGGQFLLIPNEDSLAALFAPFGIE